jgi:hypothetical protein
VEKSVCRFYLNAFRACLKKTVYVADFASPFSLLRCNALSMRFTCQVSLDYPWEMLHDEFMGSEVRCTWLLKRLNDYDFAKHSLRRGRAPCLPDLLWATTDASRRPYAIEVSDRLSAL